jgi:hypothetical protein
MRATFQISLIAYNANGADALHCETSPACRRRVLPRAKIARRIREANEGSLTNP